MTEAAEPRVVIVDDHKLFRSGVRAELEPLLEILAEAGTVAEAEAAIAGFAPDVVLLDVHMPGGGGVEVIRRAAAAGLRPTFLALSVSDAAEDVIAVIRAGARGYVTKSISPGELAEAVRRVHDGDAGTVAEAIDCIRELKPDVVLLDVHMPDGGGVAVLQAIRPELPGVSFLALSVSDAPDDVIAVIRAGARGYVTKNISPTDLADAVRRVHEGDAVFSPRLAGFVLDAFAGPGPQPETELDLLTPREREVLQHIARGYMYKEIALRLDISPKTVEAHVSSVLRKLQLSSRHELTRWAADRGLG